MKILSEFRGNERLIYQLLKKRIRDSKLRTKIRVAMISVVTLSCLAIGIWSYRDARDAVIENSTTMLMNLMKQAGLNLDERITAFRSATYQILQDESIQQIIHYSEAEGNIAYSSAVSKLSIAVLGQNYLYDYVDYGFLYPSNGVVTQYYYSRKRKLEKEEELAIIHQLEDRVTTRRPYDWVTLDGELYFVRLITDGNGSDDGVLILHMNEEFLSFVTASDILNDDNIVVTDDSEITIRNNMEALDESQLQSILHFDEGGYYVYSTSATVGERQYVMVALKTKDNSWNIVGFIPNDQLLQTVRQIYTTMLIVVAIVYVIILLVTTFLSSFITANIRVIEKGMEEYTEGRFSYRLKPASYDEIGHLALQFNYMGMRIEDLLQRVEEEREGKREAEYQTLQAQINPHFLYNTLGSLKWSCYRRGEKETAQIVDAIVNLLRFTIKRANGIVTLDEELAYIRNYIRIETMRTDNAFTVNYEIDDAVRQTMLPGFVLQPFVENSLVHGLDTTRADSCITIRAQLPEGPRWQIRLEIEDNGVGMTQDKVQYLLEMPETVEKYDGFTSIGIRIVNARLRSYFGENYHIGIDSEQGRGTRVTILMGELNDRSGLSENEL